MIQNETSPVAAVQQIVHRSVYANENDKNAAHWLSRLPLDIDFVDARSIKEVTGNDVSKYTQCHFFAGIGGWPLALEMAGWPTDASVWTGSCPCQPFSAAGKRKGTADERHLWPEFLRLITECRPATIFGEQVASKAGRDWLATVRTDLEALGYAVGAADLCAAGVGAPHIRQRLFWVADSSGERLEGRQEQPARKERKTVERGGDAGGMGDATGERRGRRPASTAESRRRGSVEDNGGLGNADSERPLPGAFGGLHSSKETARPRDGEPERPSDSGGLGNAASERCGETRPTILDSWSTDMPSSASWDDVDYIQCRDGKARPVKPGVRLLAHGIPGRVAQLRGLGNAIVPQLAAEFVAAFMQTTR